MLFNINKTVLTLKLALFLVCVLMMGCGDGKPAIPTKLIEPPGADAEKSQNSAIKGKNIKHPDANSETEAGNDSK